MSEMDAIIPSGTEPTHPEAVVRDDGFWVNNNGDCLPVSASDLERYTYCPMSWYLSATGHSGQSDSIMAGIQRHKAIHEGVSNFEKSRLLTMRNLTIWQWWFAVVVILLIDTLAFMNINDANFDTQEFSKLLALWSISCLLIAVAAILLPWRRALNISDPMRDLHFEQQGAVKPYFEPMGFKGGWLLGGRLEVAFLIASIVIALHAMALQFASDREQAAYVFAVTTIGWTLLASFRLQRALVSNNEAQLLAIENDIKSGTTVAYSDDDSTTGLLKNAMNGLRGRPDQIVIIDGEFIPVEQKTGKVPSKPHESHVLQVLAYASLVEATTGASPPYALLRYGPEQLHSISWDDEAKLKLDQFVKSVQKTMAEGGAIRNHDREGKCRNCSRRYACPDSLV
ncbi:MAG: Dna2/Cas4 domain-containing protein [Candidatus Poseidonia sp.]|nr:Dna2/Cas4 domain-containing protein [Poseidonia sp.]MBL6806994.1 Dna2/Cas4 domain-containing protein [Poseidonia sp.]